MSNYPKTCELRRITFMIYVMSQLEGVSTEFNERNCLFVATLVIWFANKPCLAFQNRIINYYCPHRIEGKVTFIKAFPLQFSCYAGSFISCLHDVGVIFSYYRLIFQLTLIIELVLSLRVYANFIRYLKK